MGPIILLRLPATRFIRVRTVSDAVGPFRRQGARISGKQVVRVSGTRNPDRRAAYERLVDELWRRIVVEANVCIQDARAIVAVPGWLLDPGPVHVLERCAGALLERAALRVINVLTDESEGALTFEYLRTVLLKTCAAAVRPQLELYLAEKFREHEFDHLRSRAVRLRHKALAHVDARHLVEERLRATLTLTISELEELLERAKGLVQVFSFEVAKGFDLLGLNEEHDMSEIVLHLLRESSWLAMPEKPEWQGYGPLALRAFASHWTEDKRSEFNEWRRKIGRKEIDFADLLAGGTGLPDVRA